MKKMLNFNCVVVKWILGGYNRGEEKRDKTMFAMKHRGFIVMAVATLMAFAARGQETRGLDRVDSLIGARDYATAYPLAQEQYRLARQSGGSAELAAAFRLTALDYAYSKEPADSALARYGQEVRRMQGVDRAVAYAFLYSTYLSVFDSDHYRYRRNTPSDDPALSYRLWHCSRMEDTLMACADSVLAYADALRATGTHRYRWMLTDAEGTAVTDTSLLSMLVQTLLKTSILENVDLRELLSPGQRETVLLPFADYCRSADIDSTLPIVLKMHRRVAQVWADGSADVGLWLDLKRYDCCRYGGDSTILAHALDRLEDHYAGLRTSADLRAWLAYRRAVYHPMAVAERICLAAEQAYPGTYGASLCRSMREYICRPELEVNYHSTESTHRSRLAVVRGRNVRWVDFRLVADGSVSDTRRLADTLVRCPAVAEWRQALPDPGDHEWHSFLVALPPMPQGGYFLVAMADSLMCYDRFQSTDAAIISYSYSAAAGKLTGVERSAGHLVDRASGQPLAGHKVSLLMQGAITGKDYRRHCRTDREGYFHFPVSSSRYAVMDVRGLAADGLVIPAWTRYWPSSGGGKFIDIVMVDRPIYRLGDTVRFSAVAYKKKVRGAMWQVKPRPATGVKVAATFGPRYGDTEDTLWLVTDRHGRCWGEFVIPLDGTNGNYRLELSEPDRGLREGYTGYRDIKVEAYKPPHFTVSLSTTPSGVADSTAGVRRFGKPITVYGAATSFSGAPMTGAKVKWEVSRERMVSPRQFNSVAEEFPYNDSLEVGDDGLFHFTFSPEADSGTMIYVAYVRVMDADGELHEQRMAFHVSDADGYCELVGNDLGHLAFAYNNFDHQPLAGAVRVELFQLRQPDTLRFLDPLMEQNPDAQWVGSRDEFRQRFPHLAYTPEEALPKLWPVEAKRLDQTTAERRLEVEDLPSGVYRVRFTCPDGTVYETVVNHVARGGRVTGNDIVWHRSSPSRREHWETLYVGIGDTVRIEMGSPYGQQPVYYCVSYAAKVYRRGMMVLDSRRPSMLAIPVAKGMEDGFVVTLAAMRDGRPFEARYLVTVRRTDRNLAVGIETFRDRLQPGEREQWHLHVADGDTSDGPAGRGMEANLCLSVYDRSLDEFYPHQYGLWPWNSRVGMMGTSVWVSQWSERRSMKWENADRQLLQKDVPLPLLGVPLPDASQYSKQLYRRLYHTTIFGTIVDKKTREGLPFVNVVVKKNGKQVDRAITDFDGYFQTAYLPEGEYEVEVSCVGYNRSSMRVVVGRNSRLRLNIDLSSAGAQLECVEIVGGLVAEEDVSNNGMTANTRKRKGGHVPKEAIAEVQAMLSFDGSMAESVPNLRTNMSTLALFEPALRSDKEGISEVTFVAPDALTQWTLHAIAWTDGFKVGWLERTLQTQKVLMVQPLLPRFLRQGDTTEIRAKVANLTDSAMHVAVALDVEGTRMQKETPVGARSSAVVAFRVAVGSDWRKAGYTLTARNLASTHGHHSDGEQGLLPVLPNRERVTQSHLLYISGTTSSEPRHAALRLPVAVGDSVAIAFNANPLTYAIEALPHFNRHRMPGNLYRANSIYVNHLMSTLSPLTGMERKRLASHVRNDLDELMNAQTREGGWSWMPGGKNSSRYITAQVLERLAAVSSTKGFASQRSSISKAVSSIDNAVKQDYSDVDFHSSSLGFTTHSHLSMLYARSFYLDMFPLDKCDSVTRRAYDWYYGFCKKRAAFDQPLMEQGQLAMLMLRMGDTVDAETLARRIKGSAHVDEKLGMYWVGNTSGYDCRQRPVETAALMVDVFADVLHDWESVYRIQQWILSAKQGTSWKTDMATAAAVRALLRQPADSLRTLGGALLTVNGTPFDEMQTTELQIEASGNAQAPTLDLQLTNATPYPAWGAVFCSREEPVDSIRYDGTGIGLRKTLSRVESDGSIRLVGPGDALHVGDRIRVHIDIRCGRDMEHMVLSDQRAAAFEPVNTASGWRWNDGLRYYVDIRDDRMDCYIDLLEEGQYYVEYDLWVRHAGVFANGIGILRSVYAPEYRANTASTKIRIAE